MLIDRERAAFLPTPDPGLSAGNVVGPFERSGGRLRILFVAPTPVSEEKPPLDLNREWVLLCDSLRRARVPAIIVRLEPPTRAHFEAVLSAASDIGAPPHIVHFAGHGEPMHLIFEDRLGQEERVPGVAFAEALKRCGVDFALLNACHSATTRALSLARYLVDADVVKAAIGHEEPVPDALAAAFAGAFYRGLAKGQAAFEAYAVAQAEALELDVRAARAIRFFPGKDLVLPTAAASPGPILVEGPPVAGNLVTASALFGRAAEIAALGSIFEGSDVRVLVLAGIGGIGKSALAVDLARRHRWRFPGGVVLVNANRAGARTAEELIKAAERLGAAATPDHVEPFMSRWARSPGLLMLDDIDMLEAAEADRLAGALEQIPSNGSRSIVTMRSPSETFRRLACARIHVLSCGLSPTAAASFVVQQARARGAAELVTGASDGSLDQHVPLALGAALAGHPALLVAAVDRAARTRQRKTLGDMEHVQVSRELAAATVEEHLDALLTGLAERLDEAALWLLGLLAVFPDGSFTMDEVAAAARYIDSDAESRIIAGLASCTAAGLIAREPDSDLYHVHQLVPSHFARRRGAMSGELGRALLGVVLHGLSYIAERRGDDGAIAHRFAHLNALLDAAWDARETLPELRVLIIRAVDALTPFMLRRGHWALLEHWRPRLFTVDSEPIVRAARSIHSGALLVRLGRVAEAKEEFRAALRLQESIDDRSGRALALHELAILEHLEGTVQDARAHHREALRLRAELGNRAGQAASLHQLAVIERGVGNVTEARELFAESIGILESLGDHHGRAASLHELAVLEYAQGDATRARALLEQACAMHEAVGDAQGRAASLQQLARIEVGTGHPNEGRARLCDALMSLREIGDPHGYAAALHEMAIIEHSQGNPTEARALLLESLQLKEASRNLRGRAASLHELAIVEHGLGNVAEARTLLDEAISIQRALGDLKGLSSGLHQLARFAEHAGNYAQASALLEECLRLKEQLGDRQGRAAALHLAAVVELSQGHTTEARSFFEEADAQLAEVADLQGRAVVAHHLADLAEREGNFIEARERLERLLRDWDERGDLSGRSATLLLLGRVLYQLGDVKAARETLAESLALKIDLGDARGEALCLNEMARIEARHDPERACATMRTTIERMATFGDRRGQAVALIALGQIESAAGRYDEGEGRVREGIAILSALGSDERAEAEAVLATLERRNQEPDRVAGRRVREAIAAMSAGHFEEADSLLAEAQRAADASGAPARRIEARTARAQVLAALGQVERGLAVLSEARALAAEHLAEVLPVLDQLEISIAGARGVEDGDREQV